jgi:hypothetical protein
MTGRERYTPDQVIRALELSHGLLQVAADALHCSATTVTRYIRRYPQVRDRYEQIKGLFVDRAELRLMQAVDEGEWRAVEYTLLTLGKKRGYVLGAGPRRPIQDDDAMDEFNAALIKAYGSPGGDQEPADEAEDVRDDDDEEEIAAGEAP